MMDAIKNTLGKDGSIFILLRILISGIVGLLGSTAVLSFLNKYAFFNYVIAQGGQTPTSTITSIDFFVGAIAIVMVTFSILFGLGFGLINYAIHRLEKAFQKDSSKVETGKLKQNRSIIQRVIVTLGTLFTVTLGHRVFGTPIKVTLISLLLYSSYSIIPSIASIDENLQEKDQLIQAFIVFWSNFGQYFIGNLALALSIWVLALALILLEKFRTSDKRILSILSNAFWVLPPALLNLIFILFILVNMFNHEKYGEFLNAIRHGGNMEVEICFSEQYSRTIQYPNCNYSIQQDAEKTQLKQILIAKTDTEVLWTFWSEEQGPITNYPIYTTKHDVIDTLIIKVYPKEEDRNTNGGEKIVKNVRVKIGPTYGDLLEVMNVFMPIRLTIPEFDRNSGKLN